jgi:hypothetical protein
MRAKDLVNIYAQEIAAVLDFIDQEIKTADIFSNAREVSLDILYREEEKMRKLVRKEAIFVLFASLMAIGISTIFLVRDTAPAYITG